MARLLYKIDPGNRDKYRAILIGRLLNSGDWGIQIDAARAMADFDDPQMIEALKNVSESDNDDLVRYAAQESLQKINKKRQD